MTEKGLLGLEGISPGRNLQLIPYGAFGYSHFLDNPASGIPSFRSQTDPRAGLDAKAVIHDSLTLDVALDPEFGARLTGKLGRWNIGLLGIDDRAPGETTDPGDPNQGDHAVIGVVRTQRDFGKQSNAGFLLTDREFAGSFNRVEAFDTRLKLNKNWTLTGQAMASQTRDLDGTHSGGDAYNIDLHEHTVGTGGC